MRKPKTTYRIEVMMIGANDEKWRTMGTWYALPRGITQGIIMGIDAFYGDTNYKFRAVNEVTGEVYQYFGGRPAPKPQ